MKDISTISADLFNLNQGTFEATIRMIEANLFYRMDEYTRFFAGVVDRHSAGIETHSIEEKAWIPILKPIHLILDKLVRSPKLFANMEPYFIATYALLISSPIEEESAMAASSIKYVLLNYNANIGNSILATLDRTLERGIQGSLPIIVISPILKFIGEMLLSFRNDLESPIASRLASLMKDRIIPLYTHSKLHWVAESYSHCLIQYFSFFEMSPGQAVSRTPFEPIFPQESPFKESEAVVLMRRALLRPNPESDRSNQISRYDVMNSLISHQFYPRSMIVEIFQAFLTDFNEHMGIESGLNIFSLLMKPEVYCGGDEVSSTVRDNLPVLQETLKRCEQMDHEMRTICHRISEQLEIINATSDDKPLDVYSRIKSQFSNLNK